MANIAETDNWPGGVYQYADGDVLQGGPESSEVLPLKQLAQRSLYQRLRNVTDWDAGLAAGFGYQAGAVVRHAGVSWRAILGNDVAPGTDPLKWERWGYSESELQAKIDENLSASVLGSLGFSILTDATGAIPGANYATGATGNIDAVTNIANPSLTKRLRIMVITASMRLWNRGGNVAILQASGQVAFGAGGFATVSNSGSTSPNDDKNGGSLFTGGVMHTLAPGANVNVTNRIYWAVNTGGAVNGGNTLLTSNVLIAKFELPE